MYSTQSEVEKTVFGLRSELQNCLSSLKAKREQVKQLETELHIVNDKLKDEEKQTQKMEKIAQEREVSPCVNYWVENGFLLFIVSIKTKKYALIFRGKVQ